MSDKLVIEHIELVQANEFVENHHRHHQKVQGHRFSVGCYKGGELVGVAIVGRPTSRKIDQHSTIEVLRLCTDGTKNVCSKLYSACRRAGKELGYKKIITYILNSENGASLKASGWRYLKKNKGGSWSSPTRPRIDKAPICPKQIYFCELN